MDQKTRAQLIRDRFKAKFPLAVYRSGPAHPRRKHFQRWARRGYYLVDRGDSLDTQRPEWAWAGDPKTRPTVSVRRVERVSPLHTMARKLAVKPKRTA